MRITNMDQAERGLNELQKIEAQIAESTATANKEIAEVRDRTLGNIGQLEEQAKRLRGSLELYAESVREDEEIFTNGKKSVELSGGILGFKLGKPAIVLRDGWSELDAVAEIKAANLHTLVTKKEEVKLDKSAVLKQYNAGKLDDKQLKSFGLQLKQDESFFIELKTVDKAVA